MASETTYLQPFQDSPRFLVLQKAELVMAKTKKKNAAQKPSVEKAALYTEDLGTQGVKRFRSEPSSCPTFDLPLTSKEKKRRKERQVRYSW